MRPRASHHLISAARRLLRLASSNLKTGEHMDSGYVGLLGVLVGAGITWLKELVTRAQERRRDAAHLAAVVSALLDSFAEDCSAAAYDDGTYRGQLDEDGCRSAQVPDPTISYGPISVQWRSISAELLHEILEFPNVVKSKFLVLDNTHEIDGPPYDDYFADRQYEYAKLGVDALSIASKLRDECGLPTCTVRSKRTSGRLRSRVEELERVRRRVDALNQAAQRKMMELVPPTNA